MADLEKTNITLYQGKTWKMEFRLDTGKFLYRAVTGITQGAPVRISSVHGMPNGWEFWLTDVVGPNKLNRDEPSAPYVADVIDSGAIEINAINGTALDAWEIGGWIKYLEPQSLAGATALFVLRETYAGAALLSLTTGPGLVISDATKTISVTITAAQAAGIIVPRGVWECEVTLANAEVHQAGYGDFVLAQEAAKA